MNNFYVISYVLGDYEIDDIEIKVYYAPAVVESFYSKKEISLLIEEKKDKDTLDGIFEIIKSRISELEAFEVWHDVIEYEGIELIWKSFFNDEEKKMGVDVLYSKDNHPEVEPVH